MTIVARLARFVVERSWDDLSDAARRALKIRVLDSLGCALGALGAPPVRATRAELDDFGGRPLCTLIGGGVAFGKAALEGAAGMLNTVERVPVVPFRASLPVHELAEEVFLWQLEP